MEIEKKKHIHVLKKKEKMKLLCSQNKFSPLKNNKTDENFFFLNKNITGHG